METKPIETQSPTRQDGQPLVTDHRLVSDDKSGNNSMERPKIQISDFSPDKNYSLHIVDKV